MLSTIAQNPTFSFPKSSIKLSHVLSAYVVSLFALINLYIFSVRSYPSPASHQFLSKLILSLSLMIVASTGFNSSTCSSSLPLSLSSRYWAISSSSESNSSSPSRGSSGIWGSYFFSSSTYSTIRLKSSFYSTFIVVVNS